MQLKIFPQKTICQKLYTTEALIFCETSSHQCGRYNTTQVLRITDKQEFYYSHVAGNLRGVQTFEDRQSLTFGG